MTSKEKLHAIRSLMKEKNVKAYIIPSSDPHTSEYPADRYKILAFASGFTGSADTIIITESFAGLWADFRYFTQAEEQLKDSGYILVKLKVQHTPEYIEWLYEQLPQGSIVAFDFSLLSIQIAEQLKFELSYKNITVQDHDFITPVWQDRPELPVQKAFLLEDANCGQTAREKLNQVRLEMKRLKTDVFILSTLDDIAWLFNLRGNDVNYNPVVLSYALVKEDSCSLFMSRGKLQDGDKIKLQESEITILPYEQVYDEIRSLKPGSFVLIDEKRTGYKLLKLIPYGCRIINATNPTTSLKSIKNPVEIEHMRTAMIKDGVALTRFFKWLEENIGKRTISELSAAEKVKWFREQNAGFAGLSFASITGYQAHAALPHYCPSEETNIELKPKGVYLLDSGGQYYYGTTDVTRTVSLGENTYEQKKDFTLVLSALISGSFARFPQGTRGYQIDALCRQPLWKSGINYGHGTGHGVGFFLNVHEGPQNIGPSNAPFAVEPGMITSIEPGIYRPGEHGIRLENLVLTIHDQTTDFGDFLQFETLTLCYIDTSLVLKEFLEDSQVQWLNGYHDKVYEELKPFLEEEEQLWLKDKCRSI